MFITTQKDTLTPTTFHDHPVVLMVVNFMRKASNWKLADVVFPNLDRSLSPDSFSIGGIDNSAFKYGSNALLANSCYNAGFTHLNEDKFREHISWVNWEFDRHSACLYAEYFRHVARLTPSPDHAAQYKSLLLSRAFRSLKRAQLANGEWRDLSMEIFIHFVKLLACGASIEEVKSTYSSLTTGNYALDPGALPLITPDAWMEYRGWLQNDYLGCADLKAQNIDVTVRPPFPVGELFARQSHYWKFPASSCFSAQSPVVLADGTTKVIGRIQPGDHVRSHIFRGGRRCESTSIVAFVSKPKRAGRTLYSYRAAPQIQFTDTHPLVESNGKTHHHGLALKFVDPGLAHSLNPSWRLLPTDRIPLNVLQVHDGGSADKDEILYDLVFQPKGEDHDRAHVNSGPTTFTVADSNGQRFDVASEAPVFQWFPYTMRFFEHVLRTLRHNSHDITTLASWLLHPNTALHHHSWAEISRAAWDQLQGGTLADLTFTEEAFSVSLDQLLYNGDPERKGSPNPQDIADAFERLHAILGRRITHEILTGWAYMPGNVTIPVLLLHSFHYLGHTAPIWRPGDPHRRFRVGLLQDGECAAVTDVCADRHGSNVSDMHCALDLSACPLRPAESKDSHARWTIGIEVHDSATGITYRGRSHVYEDKLAIVGLGGCAADADEHATIDVKVMQVSRDALHAQNEWDPSRRMRFAAALGECFAARLVSQQMHFNA